MADRITQLQDAINQVSRKPIPYVYHIFRRVINAARMYVICSLVNQTLTQAKDIDIGKQVSIKATEVILLPTVELNATEVILSPPVA